MSLLPLAESVIYVSADANRASGGVLFREAKMEFPNFRVKVKPDMPVHCLLTAAIVRPDAHTGEVLELPAPTRMSRYLEERLQLRLERLRVSN